MVLTGVGSLPQGSPDAEAAAAAKDAGEKTHLTLLAIRAIRETGARAWLQEFAKNSRGEVGRLAKKVMEGKA